MAKAKKVFEIAKELGVASKAIVEKCKAEGVPGITNHMSVVKIGLAMTIHEWFETADEHAPEVVPHTAVETAQKVDLTKAKATKRKRAAKKKIEPAKVSEPEVEANPVAPPAEAQEVVPPQVEQPAPVVEVVAPEEQAPEPKAEPTPEVEPEVEVPVAAVAPVAEPVETKPLMNVPRRPDVVKPVGVKLEKLKSVVLRGPKVVRIEQPDRIEPPRPRRSPQGGGNGGGPRFASPNEPNVPGITRSRGPERGRGAGGGGGGGDHDRSPRRRNQNNTRRGRSAEAMPLGLGKISEQDLIELDARLKGAPGYLKQRRRNLKKQSQAQAATPAETGGKVEIAEPITIKTLSAATGIKSADIIKYLFNNGTMATINSAIETEAAMEIALEYEIELEVKEQQTAEQSVIEEFEKQEDIDVRKRPPVVAVLGHVDHGKTSLLDRIRHADVADHEDGGITQHVGAYRVTIQGTEGDNKTVVFLDTPGHAAFTSMRARGANITDMIVLVVAADDGVMPQTVESINHAKEAGVPIIVALNKIDTPQATDANIQKIYGQLAEHGLNPVEWGGETEIVKTSATDGTGITDLVEILDYQAELRELKADYGGAARGMVIETEMQEGRGPVARILVQQGTLRVGDFIVIGRAFGRVRDMTDDRGNSLKEAEPSTPLELSGIDKIPDAGEHFYTTRTLKKAENVANQYRDHERQRQLALQTKVTLDNFSETIKAGETNFLRVVLKADVQGSIDVLKKTLSELGNDEVAVKVIHAAVGGITETDVLLADASDAIVLGFHVVANAIVREVAEVRGVDVRLYRVIYDLIDQIKAALEGMLKPEVKEELLGTAEIKEVFKISKVGNIAGCLVTEGSILANAMVRVIRDDVIVTDNRKIQTLRRLKDESKEVKIGTECGIQITGYEDLKPGDLITCFKVTEVARKLEE